MQGSTYLRRSEVIQPQNRSLLLCLIVVLSACGGKKSKGGVEEGEPSSAISTVVALGSQPKSTGGGGTAVSSATSATAPTVAAAAQMGPLSLQSMPAQESRNTEFTLNVSGAQVEAFRYKIGASLQTDCSAEIGYSAPSAIANPLLLDLAATADGPITLCAVGRDRAGNWQPLAQATAASWLKDTTPPGDFAVVPLANPSPADPTVSWQTAGGAVAFDLKIGRDVSCSDVVQAAPNLVVTTLAITPVMSGTYYVCVAARDALGNSIAASNNGLSFTVPEPVVLGQDGPGGTTLADGFYSPQHAFIDGTRLLLADTDNHRILIWNQLPTLHGTPPDVVVGQPDFINNSANNGGISAKSLNAPEQVIVVAGRLLVTDALNHRVLIWNSVPTQNFQSADIVLGQAAMSTNNVNEGGISAQSFNWPVAIASDGTRLAVTDNENNRVLIWNTLPTVNQQAANLVLGQPDMTSSLANNGGRTAQSLSDPYGLTFSGARLYLTDTGNSRVLIWTSLPSTNTQAADLVLGQSLMTTGTLNLGGLSASSLYSPRAVHTNGNRLYVSDWANHRVLVWNSLPTSNKAPADIVLGQPDMVTATANTGGVNATTLKYPVGIHGDGTRLLIVDSENHRLLMWNRPVFSNQESPDIVLGQRTFAQLAVNGKSATAGSLSYPTGLTYDGTHFVQASHYLNRLLIWNSLPATNNQAANLVFGQTDMTSNGSVAAAATSLYSPVGVYSSGTQLFAVDRDNHRVLIWNTFPTASQMPPDLVLGQPDMVSGIANNGGRTAQSLNSPDSIHSDGTRLFVSDRLNHRILIWNSLPTVNRQAADIVLGQANMTTGGGNSGGLSAASLNKPTGVFTAGNRLVVTDRENKRVLIWNTLPTANHQPADLVLGQPDFAQNAINNGGLSASSLNTPNAVSIQDQRLYVVDNGNHRVLVWDALPTTNFQPASKVIGQSSMTTAINNDGGVNLHSLAGPNNIQVTAAQLFISDARNNRTVIIPRGLPRFSTAKSLAAPTGISSVTTLNVTVSGAGETLSFYKYKVGPAATTDCTNAAGYSAAVASAIPITASLAGFSDGEITLCVIAQSPSGVWQPTSMATAYSWTKSTSGPAAFAITAPATSPSNASSPTVTWSAAASAISYDLIVATDWNCANPVQSYSGLTATSKALAALVDGTFTLCLQSRSAAGGVTAATNTHYPLIIDTLAPGSFAITAPAVTTNSTQPTIAWSGSLGAWTYQVKIATASGCAAPLETISGIVGTSQTMVNTYAEGTYYICLTAWDGASNSTLATNSNYTFSVDTTPSGAFSITSPGPTTDSPIPAVSWNASAGATTYALKIMASADCNAAALQSWSSLTATTKRLATQLTDATYYACVTAYDSALNPLLAANSPYAFAVVNASIALGRPNVTTNGRELGLSLTTSVASDGTKMFAADQGNQRILIWNAIPTANQTPADLVLGQADMTTDITASPMDAFQNPQDSMTDGTRFYVADASNHRVLIWSTMPTSNKTPADIVLGQPNGTSGSVNNGGRSASSLSSPSRLFVAGGRLFVTDSGNQRVLIWNTIPTTNQQAADIVLGQPNMTSAGANNGGLSAQTLSGPKGIYSDGTSLYVADSTNHRILRWDTIPTTNQEAADLVLGQPDMISNTSNNGGITAQSFNTPYDIDGDATHIAVADYFNNRILIWNSLPTVNRQAADLELGQASMTVGASNSGGRSNISLANPTGVAFAGTKLLVADYSNERILIWNSIPTVNRAAADVVFGQPDMTSDGANLQVLGAKSLSVPRRVLLDGGKLYAADMSNTRVLVWNAVPTTNAQAADVVLGQANMTGAVTTNMNSPSHVATDGTQLFVADTQKHRVLIWTSLPTVDGQAPDLALGQPNLTDAAINNGGLSAASLYAPESVATDGTRLVVGDKANHRVLIWTSMPTVTNEPADLVLGQPNMTSNTSNNGGRSAQTFFNPNMVLIVGGRLFVADASNNRVLIWDTFPTVDWQAADRVLGQADFTTWAYTTVSNTSLYYPSDISSDGTYLLVADKLNHRILGWETLPTGNQKAADFVIGQPNFTSKVTNGGGLSALSLFEPTGVSIGSGAVYVSDSGNNRVLVIPLD